MTQLNEFVELRKVLNSQLDRFEKELKKANLDPPETSPAISHPFDSPDFLPTHQLFECRAILSGALGMMLTCVKPCGERLLELSFSHHTTTALDLVIKAEIPDILKEFGPSPVSIQSLSALSKINEDKLLAVLRYLCNMHIFTNTSSGFFSNSRTSLLLLKGNPVRDFVSYQAFFSLNGSTELTEVLLDPVKGLSLSAKDSPSAIAAGFEEKGVETMYDYLAEYHPDRSVEFARAMGGFASDGLMGWIEDYPWNKIPKGSKIMDVGGGIGTLLLPLLKAFPNLSGELQDREEIIPLAKEYFQKNLPEAVKEGRVEFKVQDYLKPQSQKGDVFLMRWILHGNSDERCVTILKHVAEVMTPDSRLLIIDSIMQSILIGKGNSSAPFPVPESFGSGGHLKLAIAYEMLQSTSGRERTPEDFFSLFENAGLFLERVYLCRAPQSIIEARLA